VIILGLCLQIMVHALPAPELLSQNKDFWIHQLRADSPDLRINALQKLAELRQPDIVPQLSDVVRDDSTEVRFQAIRAITKIPTEEGRKILQNQLSEEKDPYLLSEIRRSIQSVDENLKLASDKLEKQTQKEAQKNIQKGSPTPKAQPRIKVKNRK
jgi:HEAT repeat protein